jgi:mono/diheme cytochrome c family protein
MSQPPRSDPKLPVALAATAAGAVLLGFLVFWSGRSSGDVHEWSPADHDQPTGAQAPAGGQAQPQGQARGQDKGENLVELAWSRQCATCHGPSGHGDGPSGPMVQAPDLTRADWQGRVTDDDIAQTIRRGRNKMPAFDLPPSVLQGLVARIRAGRGKK